MPRLAIAVFLLSAASVHAQEGEPPKKEPTPQERKVVVSASPLDPKDPFETPYSTDVIRREEIDRGLPRTTPEVLRETPGVNVQKTANGHGSPFLRGFTGFRTVQLIDGIRLNNAGFREGPNQYWATVDSHLIDTLEILRGPSAVLYGSDAIGGTVYLHTPLLEKYPEAFEWSARGVFRYASAEDSFTERLEGLAAGPDGALRFGLTVRDYNDVVAGRHTGEQLHTGYDEYDADVKVQIPIGRRQTLVVAAQRTRQDDPWRTHRTIFGKEWHGTSVGSDREVSFDQERDLYYVQFRADDLASFVDSAYLSLSVHRHSEDNTRITSSLTKEFREFEITQPGFFAKLGKKTDFGFFTFGAEVYRDIVSSDGFNRTAAGVETNFDRGEIADDSTVGLSALYVQDEIPVGERGTVTVGARFTRQSIDAEDVDPSGLGGPNLGSFSETYTNVSGSVRYLHRWTDELNLIAGVSQGFRAPNLDDTTAVRLVMSGQTDFPNPDLDPETSITYEIGARYRSGPFRGELFVFHTDLSDFITRVPAPLLGPSAFTKENSSDGFVRGVEFGAGYALDDHWSFRADGTVYVGEQDTLVGAEEKEQWLPKMNPATARLSARWTQGKGGPWAELVVTAVNAQTHLPPSDEADTQRIPPGGTPGFMLLTLRGGLKLTKKIAGTLSIENLTDRDYRWHGSGSNEPGTNVIVGIDARY